VLVYSVVPKTLDIAKKIAWLPMGHHSANGLEVKIEVSNNSTFRFGISSVSGIILRYEVCEHVSRA